MIIKILGSGCSNCKKLEHNAKKAVEELGIDAQIIKVQNPSEIMRYRIMSTPALVINERVFIAGRVAKTKEIKEILMRS
ncbi:thioredoxin family protein [Clostridium bovifaecis]|uniref:Thioredoxin family protein n=1 Tax=Clostridium bovifaecis TaxID=2184719 RepID=A0A6I6ETA4_9CLOT|nr:thioredoxin family protein [Clostridium bovifaecis]